MLSSDDLIDRDLVAAHLAGDDRAFGKIMERYRPKLINFINRKLGDYTRAEDLAQEVFLRLTRHIHRYDPTKKLSTWLHTMAANLRKNELRDRSRRPIDLYQKLEAQRGPTGGPLQWADVNSRPDDLFWQEYDRQSAGQIIAHAVDQLSPEHKIVFEMRDLQDLSYDEISERTDTTLGTVKSRLHRARTNIKKHVLLMLD